MCAVQSLGEVWKKDLLKETELKLLKKNKKDSGVDAFGGNTRKHTEHEG